MKVDRNRLEISDCIGSPMTVLAGTDAGLAFCTPYNSNREVAYGRPRPFPATFREFLKLLNAAEVEYLLIGGLRRRLPMGIPGQPPTWTYGWRSSTEKRNQALLMCSRHFGMRDAMLKPELFSSKR